MMAVRRQLTLFVPSPIAAEVEAIRRRLDPVQHALIAAHVTLCREDEFDDGDVAAFGRRAAAAPPITLGFGVPERFDGHGVLLRCCEGADAFVALRRAILGRADVRPHGAHVTLAHPRNPVASGNTDAALGAVPTSIRCAFAAVCLIEQVDRLPWQVVAAYGLGGPGRGRA